MAYGSDNQSGGKFTCNSTTSTNQKFKILMHSSLASVHGYT